MNKKIIVSLLLVLTGFTLYHSFAGIPEQPQNQRVKVTVCPYFDTKKLTQHKYINELLKKDGFVEGFFETPDLLNINYLYLERPQAQYTVVLCAGWFPGRKEGIATFFKMFPENCNLLFFDARGHGKSDGSLAGGIWSYGLNEYKDVMGALIHAHKLNDKMPLFLYGTCAGAFHAAHALLKLHEVDAIDRLNIRGLIFDSGWGSVATASYHSPTCFIHDMVLKKMCALYATKNKEKIKQNSLFKTIKGVITAVSSVIHTVFFRPIFYASSAKTDLFDKMHQMPIPVLYIHSLDDTYAPIQDVIRLAAQTPKKTCWWINEPSKHTSHHLKFTKKYQEYLNDFINSNLK